MFNVFNSHFKSSRCESAATSVSYNFTAICTKSDDKYENHKFLMVSNSLPENTNVTGNCKYKSTDTCYISTIFAESLNFCVELNFLKFAMKTRPWNCEVNMALLPYGFLYTSEDFAYIHELVPPVFQTDLNNDIRKKLRRITSFEPVNILVTNQPLKVGLGTKLLSWNSYDNSIITWFRKTIMELYFRPRQNTFRDTFIVMQLPNLKPHYRKFALDKELKIINVYIGTLTSTNVGLAIKLVPVSNELLSETGVNFVYKYSQNDARIWSAEMMLVF
ncbi:unnamed protein product [Orchesella dallaii]|uniref:Uncharacterized protein n=1 Tax=Orchesella dallaii TaxID=48710 RepID=A0ABP1RV51_9HEXA